ncbi:MAG: hypothetical protein HYV97_02845 [Bdellovibrio sp.]|nr:hypothetical protein [Bdellovibrio sp.]
MSSLSIALILSIVFLHACAKAPIKDICVQDRFTIPQTWLKGNAEGERHVQNITKFTLVSHENLSLFAPYPSVLIFINEGKDEYFQIGLNLPASSKEDKTFFFIIKFKEKIKQSSEDKKNILLKRGCTLERVKIDNEWPLLKCYRESNGAKFYQFESLIQRESSYMLVGSVPKEKFDLKFRVFEHLMSNIKFADQDR